MESNDAAVEVSDISFRYGNRVALDRVSFRVERGGAFGLLGPNGGGKTTLFRLMATLLRLQSGTIRILGSDLALDAHEIRRQIGVTFQSPSIDGKLTVFENLRHQAHLYGLYGREALTRVDHVLLQLGLTDRIHEMAGVLSGGLKRRVEIAKCLLHRPRLLLLDEPSTGLDPGARHDLWTCLLNLRDEFGVAILVATHLMDEAEHCQSLGILDRGKLVALGTPSELRAEIGGDCLTIMSSDSKLLATSIEEKFGVNCRQVGEALRIEHDAGHELLRDLVAAFPKAINSISLSRPTLEDVFIARTGHQFWDDSKSRWPE